MSAAWPRVKWERLKFARWAIRNPRTAINCGRYCRAIGMHLRSDDRMRGLDLSKLPRVVWPRP